MARMADPDVKEWMIAGIPRVCGIVIGIAIKSAVAHESGIGSRSAPVCLFRRRGRPGPVFGATAICCGILVHGHVEIRAPPTCRVKAVGDDVPDVDVEHILVVDGAHVLVRAAVLVVVIVGASFQVAARETGPGFTYVDRIEIDTVVIIRDRLATMEHTYAAFRVTG
jgi:hypothetical protein